MASSSKMDFDREDGALEGELERFDDFTFASSWERFISEIEAVCRLWLADGSKNLVEKGAIQLGFSNNLYKVKSELKYAMKSYCIEYYFETDNDGEVSDWSGTFHDVQMCFGVKDFLLIFPQSASGVVLDAPESNKLLSAVAIALTNCSSLWPAFLPVHDPSREAYVGIQSLGTIFTRRFEADCINIEVPHKLMHLDGLYELFVSKFAYSALDISIHTFPVSFTMKLTYRTVLYDDDIRGLDDNNKNGGDNDGETKERRQWDDDFPWSEWYSAEDPVKGCDLIAIWSEKIVESSLEMADLENASPCEADKWILLPNIDDSKGHRTGFSSQLCLLVSALEMSSNAQFMEDFMSVKNYGAGYLNSSMVIPPPATLDHVFKDLFHEGERLSDHKGEHKSSRAIKGAPLGSLFTQFCLHSLWVGNCNIRAIAVLWIEFVREVRWCWEECQPLPRMSAYGSIDLSTCLINQKLHMLAICIEKKRELNEEYQDCIGSIDESYDYAEEKGLVGEGLIGMQLHGISERNDRLLGTHSSFDSGSNLLESFIEPGGQVSANRKSSDSIRKGSSGVVGSMMLLKSYQRMHAPYTQAPPPMTEDMHEERLHAIEAFGDSFNFSAQLEKDILSSDMSAFKAANPDAVFEDFIRWHSPGDWEKGNAEESGSSGSTPIGGIKDDWPPKGRLSKRMAEQGNLWRKLWNDAPALPAYEQKSLLDPDREGEKVLHYLETLQPCQLLEQMVCTSFRASADVLYQTSFGGLKQMIRKMDQLYLTMVSVLKTLRRNYVSRNSEIIYGLRRLCIAVEHVEKLVTVAASLCDKFLQAPHLSEAVFSEYYDFYLPRMVSGSVEIDKEFNTKQEIKVQERQAVTKIFTPTTANQSWPKDTSIGNRLNGHEPIEREIIFSMCDSSNGHNYASCTPNGSRGIETHRMYIRGTSNDIRVALSVTSGD